MLTLGQFEISVINHGFLWLDGGAMFGSIPKSIWSGLVPADAENRIRLAARSLLVRAGERLILVDTGCGDKWTDKFLRIYGFEGPPGGEPAFDPAGVTDIIISHLHFDHAGGISRLAPGGAGAVEPAYPAARIYVQADNYETARNPNPKEKASYLKENVLVLEKARLELTRGTREILPGLRVHQADGHTRGLQWVEVTDGDETIAYPSDMIPTSRHLPLPFTMGYDVCAERLLAEKEDFLRRAVDGGWVVVFEHDPDVAAARLKVDVRGHFAVRESVSL